MLEKDTTTFEIGQAVFRLTDGLRFTLHHNGKENWYLIEDEANSKVFRVGLPEYTVLTLLNGRRTLAQAVAKTAIHLGPDSIDEHEIPRLAQWLIQTGIANSDASQSFNRIAERKRHHAFAEMANWLNPISFRFRLFNPDRISGVIERLIRPVTGPAFLFIWLVCMMFGGFLFLANAADLFSSQLAAYSRLDFVWFLLAWLLLKIVHECSHAVVCKRFGGQVPQAGILLLLLIPLPFVDVTSSWRFENKYQRIFTSAAGMLCEILLASFAMMFWLAAEPGVLKQQLGNLIIAATLHTILFNANPLMRFDGYFILSDWLEIPNLSTRGRNHVRVFFKRLFFGGQQSSSDSRDGIIVKVYGWMALIWMVTICFSLSFAAISLFGGIGIVMTLIASCFWVVIPSFKLSRYVVFGSRSESPNRLRFAAVCTGCIGIVAASLILIPAPATFTIPVMVDFHKHEAIRSQTSGFIDKFHVHIGQSVRVGDPLVELTNPDLHVELHSIRIELAQHRLRATILESSGDIAELQQQIQLIQATQKREGELMDQVDQLIVRAPTNGTVTTPDLATNLGTFVQPGTELLQIASGNGLRLTGLVDQDESKWLHGAKKPKISAWIWGDPAGHFVCRIDDVPPRATQAVNAPSFAANNGGPVAVIETASEESINESEMLSRSRETLQGVRFLRPQVESKLIFDTETAPKRFPGQMGIAKIRAREESLGAYLLARFSRVLSRSVQGSNGI